MLVAVVMMPVALNVIGLPTRGPGAVASNVLSPATVASLQLPRRATPDESVVALLGVRLPSSAPVSANVTGTPGNGFPYWSTTRTAGGVLTGWLAIPVCVSTLTRSNWNATSRVPLATNFTGLPTRPLALAPRRFCLTSVPSRQLPTRATPAVSVVGAAPVTLPLPDAGVNVTATPGTGLLNWSCTITAGARGRIVFTTAVWPSPASCAI